FCNAAAQPNEPLALAREIIPSPEDRLSVAIVWRDTAFETRGDPTRGGLCAANGGSIVAAVRDTDEADLRAVRAQVPDEIRRDVRMHDLVGGALRDENRNAAVLALG